MKYRVYEYHMSVAEINIEADSLEEAKRKYNNGEASYDSEEGVDSPDNHEEWFEVDGNGIENEIAWQKVMFADLENDEQSEVL
jgi:hypothetical protein